MSGTSLSTSGKVVNTRKGQMKSPVTAKEFNAMDVKAMDTSKPNVPPSPRSRGKDFLYVGLTIQRGNKNAILTEMCMHSLGDLTLLKIQVIQIVKSLLMSCYIL